MVVVPVLLLQEVRVLIIEDHLREVVEVIQEEVAAILLAIVLVVLEHILLAVVALAVALEHILLVAVVVLVVPVLILPVAVLPVQVARHTEVEVVVVAVLPVVEDHLEVVVEDKAIAYNNI